MKPEFDLLPYSINEINDLLLDYALQSNGYNIIPVVDPHELYNFCFPIDHNIESESNTDNVQNDQVALFNMFYLFPHKPIIFNEYKVEVAAISAYIMANLEALFTDYELFEKIIYALGFGNDIDNFKVDDISPDFIEQKFGSILALGLGAYSIGMKRFKDVYTKRIEYEDQSKLLNKVTMSYKYYKSNTITKIQQALEKDINEKQYDDNKKQRLINSALIDTIVIDKIIGINKYLIDNQKQYGRNLLVYISSAPRTKKIFNMLKASNILPSLNGKTFNVWRTRAHLYVMSIMHDYTKDIGAESKSTIDKLNKVLLLQEEVNKLKAGLATHQTNCDICKIDDLSDNTCHYKSVCNSIKTLEKEISTNKLRMVNNYSLLGNLGQYDEILKRSKANKYIFIKEYLSRASTNEYQNIALEKLRELENLIYLQSEFGNALPFVFSDFEKMYSLREGRDDITSSLQYLPTLLTITDSKYEGIFNNIVVFFEIPVKLQHKNLNMLSEAYSRFLDLDAIQLTFNMEHELLRLLLFIASPSFMAEKIARDKAVVLLGKLDENDPYSQELRYFIGWTGRRLKLFSESEQYLQDGIKSDGEDPRYYHGMSLNIHSWLGDPATSNRCMYSYQDCIEYMKKALSLYRLKYPMRSDLAGVCCNNLAYFDMLEAVRLTDKDSKSQDYIKDARKYLTDLKAFINIENWSPKHPEFYHTEAFLEYIECTFAINQAKVDKQMLIEKLNYSKGLIQIAISLYNKPRYIELLSKIESISCLLK